jgi:hypothetical protein
MAKGMYRDSGGWVHVNYGDKFEMSMHRSDYEDHEYRPRFEALPTKQQYDNRGSGKSSTSGRAV